MSQFTPLLKFTGRIDRRNPRNEGDMTSPYMRENLLSRDGILKHPRGTETHITGLYGIPVWSGRYYTIETGVVSPKTFVLTNTGTMYFIDDTLRTATDVTFGLSFNVNGYPKSWMYKSGEQTYLYLVDGENLYKYDGNNDKRFEKVEVLDSNDDPVNPIDVIEHKDRLCLLSKGFIFVSKNLYPDIFDDSTDSIQIVVGSGKGENLSFGKLDDKLYTFNTEGIFVLNGDTISAVATSFEIRLADERKIISSRSLKKVENAIVFLADDLNLWSFNGSISEKLSHPEKLEDFINPYRSMLDKAVATYYNNYYMLSFVETGETIPKLEIWYDAFEKKIEFVRGRNVSCYLEVDPTKEMKYQQLGRSDTGTIMYADRGYTFGGAIIVSRLWTKDIVLNKGRNVRISAFYPEFEPIGNRNLRIWYFLDGRLTDLSTTPVSYFEQNLQGETKTLGMIHIKNQSQVTSRVRPRINYSKGESVAFYINDSTYELDFNFKGIMIEYIPRAMKKIRTIGA